MIKKLILSIAVLAFVFGFTTIDAQELSTNKVAKEVSNVVDISNFADQAGMLVGQEVEIKGMVTHVCKHGGKKLFIMADDPDVQVKITTGEDIASFPPELEGSKIWVKGVVEAQDVEVEEEAKADHEEDAAHKNIYHKKQYSISCSKYKVKE